MAYNFAFPLRIVQFVFAIIVLALTAYGTSAIFPHLPSATTHLPSPSLPHPPLHPPH